MLNLMTYILHLFFIPFILPLNISELSVEPTIAVAQEKVSLKCVPQEQTENDSLNYVEWSKLINGTWIVFNRHPPLSTEADNMTTNEAIDYDRESSVEGNIVFTKSSFLTIGWYKCGVNSSLDFVEKQLEIRVIYKPEENSGPEMNYIIEKDVIKVVCSGPPSYPASEHKFFINNEKPLNEEVKVLPQVMISNTSYGDIELPINVAELNIRATESYVLNAKIEIVCTATQSKNYHSFKELVIDYTGDIIEVKAKKSITGAVIALIIIAILVAIITIAMIVWFVIRKKKINAINKVAELFVSNKQVILVDKT